MINRYALAIVTFLARTIASASIAYYFTWRQHINERREQIFEEVSVLIENGQRIIGELDRSFRAKQPRSSRIELWNKFHQLQNDYYGNKSRLLFLLNKYFGAKIAEMVMFSLSDLDSEPDLTKYCESNMEYPYSFITYEETWAGTLSSDRKRKNDGFKWKMMKKCGMDVSPFLESLNKENSGATQ